MSAYALPGFFPPMEKVAYTSPATYESSSCSTSCCSSASSSSAPSGPLHEQNDNSRISSLLIASVDRFYSVSSNNGDTGTTTTTNSSSDKAIEKEEASPGIAVREAKIDPVRLVQCVTGTTSKHQQQQQPRKTLRRRNAPDGSSPQNSPTSGGKKVLYAHDNNNNPEKKNQCSRGRGAPHDEAIEFELSISFNGRKYEATRTLQCIVQLRDDLIREMNSRKRWLQIRRANMEQPSSCSPQQEDIHIQIPEIPSITGDDNGSGSSGIVGRGFIMLHAMVTSYVPVMERWLRNVMVIVPQDSECLSNFLWEPLVNETPLSFSSVSCASLATLGSIKELDYHTEDDDSEDDDEW